MTSSLAPIVDLPYLNADGCELAVASNTTLTVEAGQVRDSTNTFDIVLTEQLTLNAAVNGANGLDTGTFAASTGYYVFVISDPTGQVVPATLLSTSATAPIMPSVNGVTYGAFRCIGWVVSDSSTHFLAGLWNGNGRKRYFQYNAPVTALNAGAAGTATDVSLDGIVPATGFGRVQIKSTYVPHAAAETASVRAKASASYTYVLQGIVASVAQPDVFEIVPSLSSGVPKLTYVLSVTTSPAALSLAVTGFEFNI